MTRARVGVQIKPEHAAYAKTRCTCARYAVGTRSFTTGLSGPNSDLGPVRELLAWRDAVNS
ncbi:MAG: hypothetical protein ABIP45_03840 [Knoellia sp.]